MSERDALRAKAIERHRLNPGTQLLDAALDVALEEAAKVAWKAAQEDKSGSEIAAAVLALKGKP